MREQIEMMPTSSGMEIRFKQLANEMKVLYETVSETFVTKKNFEREMKATDLRTAHIYLSKADFKKNWTLVQKRLEKSDETSKKTIKIVQDNTEYLEKLKKIVANKAEKEVV